MINENQLKQLLSDLESDRVKRTISISKTDKFCEVICAFANLSEKMVSLPLVAHDPYCLSLLKHHRSLIPMALEARKPIFFLKSADGAIGAHVEAVRNCYTEFQKLAGKIASSANIAFD